MVTREYIRTEVTPGDDVVGDLLDNGPPISLKENVVAEPVADQLLAGLRPAGLSEFGGKGGLRSAGKLNSSLQRSNVSFLHGHPKYTNRFVSATIPFVCQENKEACTVLSMSTPARKQVVRAPIAPPKARPKKRQAKAGKDGKTLGERLALAMAHETGRRGHEYRQADLLADVNRLVQAPDDEPALTQQMLSAIMRNQVTRSSYTSLMAAVCHVDPIWLSDGVGSMTK